MNKLLASSVDPKQLSLTIKGVLVAVIPLVGLALKATGHQINDTDLQTLTEQISNIVILLGTLLSSIMMCLGALRKLLTSG